MFGMSWRPCFVTQVEKPVDSSYDRVVSTVFVVYAVTLLYYLTICSAMHSLIFTQSLVALST